MRLVTIVSAAVLATSTAVIAQVGSSPIERKTTDDPVASANDAAAANVTGNASITEPASPSTALVNSVDGRPPK